MNSGDAVYNTIDSLSAFWPGLATLAGDIQNAIKLHLMYWNLWRRHSGLCVSIATLILANLPFRITRSVRYEFQDSEFQC